VGEGTESRHGISFGAHYDPENTFFGALLAQNEELLDQGAGFPTHRHREADLVTWVLTGELRHTDSLGNARTVHPGELQVLAAGTGVEHAEFAGAAPTTFLQSWLVPDDLEPPALYSRDFTDALGTGCPVLVAAGSTITASGTRPALTADPAPHETITPALSADPHRRTPALSADPHRRTPALSADPHRRTPALSADPLPLRRSDAALWIARLPESAGWTLPQAPYVQVRVVRGGATTPAGELGEGDELRLTDEPAQPLTAGAGGAEVLVWTMGSDLRL
jgi:redox-sensitive bicupin YhaK (pirin superfamily)